MTISIETKISFVMYKCRGYITNAHTFFPNRNKGSLRGVVCLISNLFYSFNLKQGCHGSDCINVVVFYIYCIDYLASQICIKRSLWDKEKIVFKTGDLLKEVQFIWNFL